VVAVFCFSSCCWFCSVVLALLWVGCRNPASLVCFELALATSADETAVNLDLSPAPDTDDDEAIPGRHNDLLPAAVGCACTDNIGLRVDAAAAAAAVATQDVGCAEFTGASKPHSEQNHCLIDCFLPRMQRKPGSNLSGTAQQSGATVGYWTE